MKSMFVSLLILMMTSIPTLPLQDPAPEALSLEDCIQQAVTRNPLIQSSYQQHQAALARVSQAKALAQPSVNWDSDLQPKLFDFKGTGEWYFGVSQELEFPGKRGLRGRIAGREADEIMQDIELLKLDVVFQVKQAFFSLLLSQEKLAYAERNLELSRNYQNQAELKFEAGDVARVEVLRAKVETSKAANQVRASQSEVRLAKAYLNYLMARKKYAPLTIQGELDQKVTILDLETLKQRAMSFRPEITRIQHSLDRERLQKKSASMSYLPDFEIGVNRHKVLGEGSWWDVTLSFPIPLFFWQPARGEIAEAAANIRVLQKETEHLENTIGLEVEEAFTNAQGALNQIRLYEDEILTQAEEVYNMFQFSYQEGEIGGIELIEARRTLIEARTSYADALFNYRTAIADLEKSIGQTLEGELP